MQNKSFLEHPNYPTLMFLMIILTSLIILFSFVDFVEDIDKEFTAYVIQQQELTPEIPEPKIQEEINLTAEDKGKVYSLQAWGIFYTLIISVIILIAVLSVILKNTIKKNIKEKEKQREVKNYEK